MRLNYRPTDECQRRIDERFPRGVRQFYSLGSPPNCSNFPRDTKRMVWMWVYTKEWFDIQRGEEA